MLPELETPEIDELVKDNFVAQGELEILRDEVKWANTYFKKWQAAEQGVQRTAFAAFCGGVIFGMFVMFVLGALL